MTNKYKKMLISWIDVQCLEMGLCFPDDIPDEPVSCEIIGFLVKETKYNYFLAKEVWETGQCKYIHVIPKKYVIDKFILIKAKKEMIK